MSEEKLYNGPASRLMDALWKLLIDRGNIEAWPSGHNYDLELARCCAILEAQPSRLATPAATGMVRLDDVMAIIEEDYPGLISSIGLRDRLRALAETSAPEAKPSMTLAQVRDRLKDYFDMTSQVKDDMIAFLLADIDKELEIR